MNPPTARSTPAPTALANRNRHRPAIARALLALVASVALSTLGCSAHPPRQNGPFRAPDLVELVTVDPTIHLREWKKW